MGGCYGVIVALVCVEAADGLALERAQVLADFFKIPLCAQMHPHTLVEPGVKLVVAREALALAFLDKRRGKPYSVDFLSSSWRVRWQRGLERNHIFRRALGLRDKPLKIIDATAGFGQDAAMMVALGCEVTAIEQSCVVAALLRDGIERACLEDEQLRLRFSRLKVVQGDASAIMIQMQPEAAPDVVYLDPMFIKPKSSAKSPKEMQLLQELLPTPDLEEEEKLFQTGMKMARERVVVKRPLKARAMSSAPHHMFKGQSVRYDVYLKVR